MALTSTTTHPKFIRLVFKLERCLPAEMFRLAQPLALGFLESLWQQTHASGNPFYSPADVETICRWPFDEGGLVALLTDPACNFLDRQEDGRVVVHDYWDHAPEFVRDRMRKRNMRAGKSADPQYSPAAPVAPLSRTVPDNPGQSRKVRTEREREEEQEEEDLSADPSRTDNPGDRARGVEDWPASVGVGRRACAQDQKPEPPTAPQESPERCQIGAGGASPSQRPEMTPSGPPETPTANSWEQPNTAQTTASAADVLRGMRIPILLHSSGTPGAGSPGANHSRPAAAKCVHPPTEADRGQSPGPTERRGTGTRNRADPSPGGATARGVTALSGPLAEFARLVHTVSGDGPEYAAWWQEVVQRAYRHGVEWRLREAVQYAQDCGDPVKRQIKDLGELRRPGAYMAKQIEEELRERGAGLPAKPKTGKQQAVRLN